MNFGRLKALFFTFFILIGFVGCGSNISKVKDTVLEFDKSLTVGQAFDNYQYFKSKKWEDIRSDNGKELVQFEGILNIDLDLPRMIELKKSCKEVKVVFQFVKNKDNTVEIHAYGTQVTNIDGTTQEAREGYFAPLVVLHSIYQGNPL